MALRFFAAGYQVFILTYSVGEKAKRVSRCGSSSETPVPNSGAGNPVACRSRPCGGVRLFRRGHLACSLGVMWDDPELLKRYDNHGGKNRPDAMIPDIR